MASSIPVPVEFQLPDGWKQAPPDEVGAPGAAFVALRPPAEQGFTPNITISGGHRADDATLDTIADESLQRLAHACDDAALIERTPVGSVQAPGLTQLVRLHPGTEQTPRELVQSQVYLALLDVDDPHRRVVLEVVLTATPDQLAGVVEDFQDFVGTVRPKNSEAQTGDH